MKQVYKTEFPKYCIFMRETAPSFRGGWSTSNKGGQVDGTTHFWEGTWLIENHYTYIYKIYICKC